MVNMEVGQVRSNPSALWRVIYIARGEDQARQVEDLLTQAGFMVDRKRPATGEKLDDIEIRTLTAEAEEARLYLMEKGY